MVPWQSEREGVMIYHFLPGADDAEFTKPDMEWRGLVSTIGLLYHQNVYGTSERSRVDLVVVRFDIGEELTDAG